MAECHDPRTSFSARVPSFDSLSILEGSSETKSWSCPQCSYVNVDFGNARCALCGERDSTHPAAANTIYYSENKSRPKQHFRRFSWASSSSSCFDFQNSLSSSSHHSKEPLTHAMCPQRSASFQTSEDHSLLAFPLIRPTAEYDDQRSQPYIPSSLLRTSQATTTTRSTGHHGLLGPSLGALVFQASRQPGTDTPQTVNSKDTTNTTPRSVSSHSMQTVQISNRSPIPEFPNLPPSVDEAFSTSNRNIPCTIQSCTDKHDCQNQDGANIKDVSSTVSDLPRQQSGDDNHVDEPPLIRRIHSEYVQRTHYCTIPEDMEQASSLPPPRRHRPLFQECTVEQPQSNSSSQWNGSQLPRSLATALTLIPPIRRNSPSPDMPNYDYYTTRQQSPMTSLASQDIENDETCGFLTDQPPADLHHSSLHDEVQEGDEDTYPQECQSNIGTTALPKKFVRNCLAIGNILLLVVVATLVAVLIGNKSSGSSKYSSGEPPSAATVSPVTPTLQLITTIHGDEIGSSIAIGGPLGDWIGLVERQSVRVARFNPSQHVLESVGNPISFSKDQPSMVSMSAERRRLAVSHGGQLSVYQRSTETGEWEGIINGTNIHSLENTANITSYPIASSCSISGSGLVAVGSVLHDTEDGLFVTIQTFVFDVRSTMSSIAPFSIPVAMTTQPFHLKLSYEGDMLAVLANNSVFVYQRERRWVWSEIDAIIPDGDDEIVSITMSGDGNVLATAGYDETKIYTFSGSTETWSKSSSIPSGGRAVTLSYDGTSILIGGHPVDGIGSATLWQRTGDIFFQTATLTGKSGSSAFGMSVAIPENRQWEHAAVSAGNGHVELYQLLS